MLILKMLFTELIRMEEIYKRDPRTSHLPGLGPPWTMVTMIGLYLLFIKVWGPKFMHNRRPFDLKTPMQIYNVVQVILNAYVFYGAVRYSYSQPYFSFTCQEYNPQDSRPSLMKLRHFGYIFYITKYLDLLDTVFFVLRKKNNQITFLHVYHHSLMIYAMWAYLTLMFGAHYTATGVINSLIHVIMYAYYFVAAFKLKINLAYWKRWLTRLQLLQFLYLSYHFSQPIFNNWCGLDMFWTWLAFVQNFFMLILFGDFYYKAYVRPKKSKAAEKQVEVSEGVLKTN